MCENIKSFGYGFYNGGSWEIDILNDGAKKEALAKFCTIIQNIIFSSNSDQKLLIALFLSEKRLGFLQGENGTYLF